MMYLYSLIALIPLLLFSAWASAKVNSTYAKYDKVPNRACVTGYDTAVRMMRNRGVTDIRVERINGRLTDHYHPTKKQVNLSMSTFGSASVGAVAVAAHEIGHVMQKKEGYLPYKIRNVLVPLTNIGSRLALPMVIVGVLLELFIAASLPYGEWLVYAGIAFYGLSTLFMLVTLPVEFNASRRAKKNVGGRRRFNERGTPRGEQSAFRRGDDVRCFFMYLAVLLFAVRPLLSFLCQKRLKKHARL